jgi:hypothetical protein
MNRPIVCASLALAGTTGGASAAPAIWESDYGSELTSLTLQDDVAEMVTLSFGFEYDGVVYTDLYVGTNGGIGLGGLGEADDYPSGDEFADTSSPMLSPFWSDLDLDQIGNIYFNDFGDRAVVTWMGVGTYENKFASETFQVQVFNNGRIVFGYNGISENTTDNFDCDIHVGLTQGGVAELPVPVDFSDLPFASGPTVLDLFLYGEDPFDLDQTNIVFTPDGQGGYLIAVPTPGATGLLGLGLFASLRRRA